MYCYYKCSVALPHRSVDVSLFVLFFCFTSKVNSYGHGGTVSSPTPESAVRLASVGRHVTDCASQPSVPCVSLQCVIVVFPHHTHLLFGVKKHFFEMMNRQNCRFV